MRKLFVSLILIAGCAGGISHNAAQELRYTGVAAVVGGSLMVAAPAFNGDSLRGRNTTPIGVTIDLAGIAAIVASYALDNGR